MELLQFHQQRKPHIKQFWVSMVLVAMGTTRVRMQVKVMTAGSRMVEMQHECLRRDKIKKNKNRTKKQTKNQRWHSVGTMAPVEYI